MAVCGRARHSVRAARTDVSAAHPENIRTGKGRKREELNVKQSQKAWPFSLAPKLAAVSVQ